jgi:hypothetical protein
MVARKKAGVIAACVAAVVIVLVGVVLVVKSTTINTNPASGYCTLKAAKQLPQVS